MKKVIVVLVLVSVAGATTQLPQPVLNALTGIDTQPTTPQLDMVWGGKVPARDNLSMIAQDASADVGVRLRAIHALAKYCPPSDMPAPCTTTEPAHQALAALITNNAAVRAGSGLLLLRAAIESLGPLRVGNDLSLLLPLLDHPSRDIRASTARALRDLCNTQAINPLRVRQSHESIEQVRLAISDALRVLSSPPCAPVN